MNDDTMGILRDLALNVERLGVFPERDEFLLEQQARINAFDALEQARMVFRWQHRLVWSVRALMMIAQSSPFAKAELERGRSALETLREMYGQTRRTPRTVADVQTRLGWPQENDVRRALILLQPFPIFDTFGVWLEDAPETFVLNEQVLRLDPGSTFALPRRVHVAPPPANERELALEARELFLQWFAGPYRESGAVRPVGPRHGTQQQRERELLKYDYLAHRGLIVHAGSQHIFRLSSRGKALAFRDEELDQILGLAPSPKAMVLPPTTVNNFLAPIGAVAAAPGASAHGTIVQQQIDQAMHRAIVHQDELGDLTDVLLPLLRKTRKVEQSGLSEAAMQAAITEAEEFKTFERTVKSAPSRAFVKAASTVLEAVPLLKAALGLLDM